LQSETAYDIGYLNKDFYWRFYKVQEEDKSGQVAEESYSLQQLSYVDW